MNLRSRIGHTSSTTKKTFFFLNSKKKLILNLGKVEQSNFSHFYVS